jgi:hypothetical protein
MITHGTIIIACHLSFRYGRNTLVECPLCGIRRSDPGVEVETFATELGLLGTPLFGCTDAPYRAIWLYRDLDRPCLRS